MAHRFTKLALVAMMAASPIFLGACVIVDADEHTSSSWDMDRDYGSLKGAEVSANQITARVSSNGCTTKDFIGTDVRKSGEDSFTVGFYREKQDYCRANLPDGRSSAFRMAQTFQFAIASAARPAHRKGRTRQRHRYGR